MGGRQRRLERFGEESNYSKHNQQHPSGWFLLLSYVLYVLVVASLEVRLC